MMSAHHYQHRLQAGMLLLLLLGNASAFVPTSPSLVLPSSFPSPSHQAFSNSIQQRKSDSVRIKTNNKSNVGVRGIRKHCSGGLLSSSSALAATPLPVPQVASIGTTIAKFYKGFPLLAGFLTAATKACFADRLAQYRDVCTTEFDGKRNLAMVLYSGLILGMSCEIMYNRIFPVIFGPAPVERSLVRAIKMTLFDGFINAPLVWLPPAYIFQALVYRYPKREAIQKYITDVKENGLLKKYWSLWMPVSMINFCFVPAHFRIAFVAAVSFFWMIILSITANNSQDAESCPLEPEPAMLNPRALE